MKDLIKFVGTFALAGIGMNAGFWVWENVLEDKVDNLKDKLSKKLS